MRHARALIIASGLLLSSNAFAQSSGTLFSGQCFYGINRADASLTRYDFDAQQSSTVGTVQGSAESAMTGIDASAYIPGFQNIFAFWTDPSGSRNKLVYVDTETAQGAVVADDLEGGRFTGAVAVGGGQQPILSFDGMDDFVELPHQAAYLLDEGTIRFRFNAADVTNYQGLFSKDSSGYDTGGHVHIFLEGNRVKVRLQSTTSSNFITSAATIQANTWYDVAFTFGPTGMKLYLNGIEAASGAYVGGLGTTSGGAGNFEPIVLGASGVSSGDQSSTNLINFFEGQISHAEIVDHVLAAGELTQYDSGLPTWNVYAVQVAQVSPPAEIGGSCNINPNNSPQNEFTLTKPDGSQITRDDLRQNSPVNGNGEYYVGACTEIRVKPKGNGNQNSLTINGQTYPLQNSNTYVFTGDMSARLYNDHIHSNVKAMGTGGWTCRARSSSTTSSRRPTTSSAWITRRAS